MPRFGLVWIVLTLSYCSGIFYLSSLPDLDLPSPAWLDWPGSDKVIHTVIYGGLAGLVALGLDWSNPLGLSRRRLMLIPILFAVFYGVTDEVHQSFVPTRSPDLLDLLADAIGATIITGVYSAWIARSTRAAAPVSEGNSARLPGD